MQDDEIRYLWLAVIIQQLDDYIRELPVGANIEEQKAAKIQAIAWIEGNSHDYKEVCSYAQIDAEWLRDKVRNSTKRELNGIIKQLRGLMWAS